MSNLIPEGPTIIHRFAITAEFTVIAFRSLLQGRGLNALRIRHSLLAATKAVLGNKLYTRLRSGLLRSDR